MTNKIFTTAGLDGIMIHSIRSVTVSQKARFEFTPPPQAGELTGMEIKAIVINTIRTDSEGRSMR